MGILQAILLSALATQEAKLSGPQPMEHLQILVTVERVKRQAWRVFVWMPWVELLLRKLIRLAGVSFA